MKKIKITLLILFSFWCGYEGHKNDLFPLPHFIKRIATQVTAVPSSTHVTITKTNAITSPFPDEGYKVELPTNFIAEKRIRLNNFVVDWDFFNVPAIKKTGHALLEDGWLWFINQDDQNLLRKIGLESSISHNGGIKAFFKLSGEFFFYVAYHKDGCSKVSIFKLKTKTKVLDLPCLPNSISADLNGSGGTWEYISENEIIFSIGTPSKNHTSDQINLLAQNNESFYGKFLRLKIDAQGKLSSEIFSTGHRNPQGVISYDSKFYAVEHGPMGGDEVNILVENQNYGWPLQSLGSEYDLEEINKDFSKPLNAIKPLYSFTPSIGISSINKCPKSYEEYYSPNKCLAVSSMRGGSIFLLVHDDNRVFFNERLDFGSRIRKFFIRDDNIIAVTDFNGIIIGNLKKL